jgi:hypothetical protein
VSWSKAEIRLFDKLRAHRGRRGSPLAAAAYGKKSIVVNCVQA